MEETTPGAQTPGTPAAPAAPAPAVPAPVAAPTPAPVAQPSAAPQQPQAAPAPEPVQPQAPAQVPPSAPVQPTVAMPAGTVESVAPAAPAELAADWPIAGYTGPQPWQVQSPPALSHNRGFVVAGAAGDLVQELAAALAHLGYETSISRGENPQALYGDTERAAVRRFQTDFGIAEDPAVIAVTTPDTVGPWTWEALFRLLRRATA